MFGLRIGFIVLLVLATAQAGLAQEKDGKKEEGFRPLFDGKTLDGWEIMNKGKFSAADGVIKIDGGSGWLRSNEEHADFILKLELRFMKVNQDGGVFLRASKEGANWPNQRVEVQCHNDKSMGRIFGAKYKLDDKKVAEVFKPVDEWNTYEIKCEGGKLDVMLNGALVTTAEGLTKPSGYIGLQGEGGKLEFRNIRIKKIETKK